MIEIIIIFLGVFIRGIAIIQMQKNDLWHIVKPISFKTNGIYGIIRHPMYLGALLIFIPLWWLADRNIITTIIFGIFLFSFLFDRIDREEQNMLFHYGKEYWEYMQKTKILIPYIW